MRNLTIALDSAFPVNEDDTRVGEVGLTKREYMATACLAGMLANQHIPKTSIDAAIAASVKFADALIIELNKSINE